MNIKQEFIDIYKRNIKREGSAQLLEYLLSGKSDFFTAPASTKYHNSYEGGFLSTALILIIVYMTIYQGKE